MSSLKVKVLYMYYKVYYYYILLKNHWNEGIAGSIVEGIA